MQSYCVPRGVSLTLQTVAQAIGAELLGEANARVDHVDTLNHAEHGAVAFIADEKYLPDLLVTKASAVIGREALLAQAATSKLVVSNPYLAYAKLCQLLYPHLVPEASVHPTAVIAPNAKIDASAHVAAGVVIESGAVIGAGAEIGARTVIGARSQIGKDTRLHAGVTVYHDCVIGDRVIIHSGAVIGADGFGNAEDHGRWIKIPQLGRVVVGDDVEIGANTTIDRGALSDTVIEAGARLDNQIQIGHNCVIGAHTAIAGCVGIAGSTRVGQHCKIGGAAMLVGHIEIADHTVISGGTLVAKSIANAGVYTGVFPMSSHEDWIKNAALIRRLAAMHERLRQLELQAKHSNIASPTNS